MIYSSSCVLTLNSEEQTAVKKTKSNPQESIAISQGKHWSLLQLWDDTCSVSLITLQVSLSSRIPFKSNHQVICLGHSSVCLCRVEVTLHVTVKLTLNADEDDDVVWVAFSKMMSRYGTLVLCWWGAEECSFCFWHFWVKKIFDFLTSNNRDTKEKRCTVICTKCRLWL